MKFRFPELNSRAVFVGQTGSGKTTAARLMLLRIPAYKFVIVYDVKGQMKRKEWPGFEFVSSFDELKKKAELQSSGIYVYPKLVFQPNIYEVPDENDLEPADRFFKFVYFRTNTVVYVDEVYGVTTGRRIPFHFKAILTRGRERGITCFMATQRPAEIPQFILSESENFYVFQLQMPQDKKRIREIKGIPESAIEGLEKFEFLAATDSGYSTRKRKLVI